MSQVNTELLEVNKPSVLTQIVFTRQVKKELKLFEVSGLQVDLANVLLYQLWKKMNIEKLEIDTNIPSTLIEIDLADISNMIGKYKRHQYKEWIYQLDALSDVKVVINSLNKKKDEDEMVITRFIHEIRYTHNKQTNKKTVKVAMSNIIASRYMNNNKFFSKMFLKIQFSLHSKYSKLLYELMKDYEGISKTIDITTLYELLNVTEDKQRTWSVFRPNILEKAVKEINSMTDISVEYEPIKSKPEGERLQVTAVKFTPIEQDDKRLQSLGIKEAELSRDEQSILNKKKAIALIRLEQSKQFQTINNEEAWLKKTVESITDEFIEQQDLIEVAKQRIDELTEEELKIFGKLLMDSYGDIISFKEYKLYYAFDETKPPITNNAKETYDVLLALENE